MSAAYRDGFARGLRECVDMLGSIEDTDDCAVASSGRPGRRQHNAVRQALGRVLMRGDAAELDGFCAGLTEIIASADESGDWGRILGSYANKRERVMRRVEERRAVRA